jgi:pilus assembly protein CpaE
MTARPVVHVERDLPPELTSAIEELGLHVQVNGWPAPQPAGKIIVVVSPKGGSGKTAVTANLAVALARRHPGQVVAVDLDVQFGDLSTALALRPERTLAQLVQANELDATTAKLFLTPYGDLFVLAAAENPADADVVTHGHITTVLPLLAQEFRYVLVDTSAGLDERTLSAIECASDLLLVSSLDVTSIKTLRKALDALDTIGVKATRNFVLNRADAKVGLDPSDAADAVGLKPVAMIPSSRVVPTSLNMGTPVVLSDPKSAVAKQLEQLSYLLAPAVDNDKAKRGWRR